MIVLWYLLGFLSASAAFSAGALVYAAKRRKVESTNNIDNGFLSILKF